MSPRRTSIDCSACAQLHEDDLGALRRQLHVWGAAHDHTVTTPARNSFSAIWDEVEHASGGRSDEVRQFMAQAVLLTILASLDLMDLYGVETPMIV